MAVGSARAQLDPTPRSLIKVRLDRELSYVLCLPQFWLLISFAPQHAQQVSSIRNCGGVIYLSIVSPITQVSPIDMANNRKTAPTAKVSSTSTSQSRSQAASKENPTTTKKVTAPRQEAAGKAVKKSQPLQESRPRISLHGSKDANNLALLERIALQQGMSSCLFD